MKFLKTSEYAIKILIHIGRNEEKNHSAQKIHESLGIPYKYLGRVLTQLSKNGFLNVTRGKYGGYVLSRPANEIRMIQILDKFEGKGLFDRCILGIETCSIADPCELHKHWAPIRNTIKMKFSKLSLRDLIHGS